MNPVQLAALTLLAGTCAVPAFAAPTTYVLDQGHSFVRFGYDHMGFSRQQSRFNKVTGSITYDPQAKTGSVDVVIDLKSVDTGSILDQDIQTAGFFDTAKFPTATFKSTHVRFDGDRPVRIEGDLTIKGVTRPVTLAITHFKAGTNMMNKHRAIGADATTQVKRSQFNMGMDVPLVSDDVTITIDFEAQAE